MTARRLFVAFMIAVLLGAAVAVVKAQDEDPDKIIVYYPGICADLPKYGYWYYFFGCHLEENNAVASQVVTLDQSGDTLTTEITRVHADGSVSWIRREQRIRRQP